MTSVITNIVFAVIATFLVSLILYLIIIYNFRKKMYVGVWSLTSDFADAVDPHMYSTMLIYPDMSVIVYVSHFDENAIRSTKTDKFTIGMTGAIKDSELFEDAKIKMDQFGTMVTIVDDEDNLLGEYYKDNTVEIEEVRK